MAPSAVDYSLYLVTDSTPAILGEKDLVEVVEAACQGGTTVVQYRDKTSDTGHLIKTAKKLHAITQKFNVPLLINDRLDVALAVGCEGVHIGQDDMDLATARKILGSDAIIGVTVCTIKEAQVACEGGADYLGIGTVYSTQTKKNTKSIIGTQGVQAILCAIAKTYASVKTVCIGGINASNVQRVLYQASPASKPLDGVAIVSAIVAAESPKDAASFLLSLIKSTAPFVATAMSTKSSSASILLENVPQIVANVAEKTPLSHNMTNLVVQNFAANVALSIGASPIMANYGMEATDLCKLGGALVVNMGTVTPDGILQYIRAIQAYNLVGGPVVFDPVGAGATVVRRGAVKELMAAGYFSLIKGNENEIRTVLGETGVVQRGVDSGVSTLDAKGRAKLARDLAAREKTVVLMTGKVDYVSDGVNTVAISNGCELLGEITGSGCVLGTICSAMLAVERADRLAAVVAGCLMYEIAAERAVEGKDDLGPGSFVPALIDGLYGIRKLSLSGNLDWVKAAKVEFVEF